MELDGVGELARIAIDSPLEVNGQFALNSELDPKPGQRIQSAEALFYIAGTRDEFFLGEMEVEDDGKVSATFPMPDLGEGEHQLAVRLRFKDETILESIPAEKEGYYGIRFTYSMSTDGSSCYQANGESVNNVGITGDASLIWTAEKEFTVDQFGHGDWAEYITLETLSGRLTSEPKSISFDYEYAYNNGMDNIYIKASMINIPFVERVENDGYGWRYDKFIVVGDVEVLRTYAQFFYRSSVSGEDVQEISLDSLVLCDNPGKIEILMLLK